MNQNKHQILHSTFQTPIPFLLFPFLLLIAACEIINPEEMVPAFIEVQDFQLTTTAIQGSDQHQINDVWAFVGGEPLGVFELPASIPVLAEGAATITLLAGVRENGLRSTPVIYPFYDRYETNVTLSAGETISINPTITYNNNSIFELIEDFETNNLQLSGAIQRTTTPQQILEGTGSGRIPLIDEEALTTSTRTFLELPTSGGLPVFLEMDYKTNVDLEVGLIGLNINAAPEPLANYKVILSPINRWNKVYINFQEDLAFFQREGYQLAFRAINTNTTTPEILLDNIKLIRFQP